MRQVDVLVVGAGLAGAVMARRLAADFGCHCLVVERRRHVAGLAHDAEDAAGVRVPSFGPHYFRSNAPRVVDYLGDFTEWRPVTYRVQAFAEGRYWQFPINLDTYEQLVGRPATSAEMEAALAAWREPIAAPRSSEELMLAQVGRRLYELFYRGYTRKAWGCDASELDPSVCGRIPVRTDRNPAYLTERFQATPAAGHTALVQRLLRHERIELLLDAEHRAVRAQVRARHVVYTGLIDEYYDQCFGPLGYRSLRWEHESVAGDLVQPALQVNYPNDHDYTRVIEPKHMTGQKLPTTTLVREYPQAHGPGRDPFYALPTPGARALYERYAARAAADEAVTFVGRLARYQNLNMDQVVGMALAAADKLGPRLVGA